MKSEKISNGKERRQKIHWTPWENKEREAAFDLLDKENFENIKKSRVRISKGISDFDEAGRIPTVKLKIPGKAFLKSESRTSVTFKL